ncbi:hypothetical protein Pla52o_02720 [Novipirellula galeiformis]|uniref:Uncharacterized protein n=1 Tax=Novipirellula galeiformis TaxID=2528004 RepID=A0A5C6CUK6_9BACT|nr:hypothetical protein [Novipirellula galeiformis]TWU26419.1 hypothetical protein Pla52o_02720 [Novipirellula galeiformis]
MNRQTLTKVLMTTSFIVCMTMKSDAQQINASHLFGNHSYCGHVIDLISQHGVNNTFHRGSTFHSSPFGHVLIPSGEIGDLQIVEVHQHEPLDSACGPTFAIVIQNQSTRRVCGFHVSAVAVFGHICPTSPNVTVKTDKIEAGESLEVLVTLPIEALAMGNRNGQVIGFQRLVVAIDSFDELMESDEANNLKAFDAASIPVVSVSVSTTVESESVSTIQSDSVQNVQPLAENLVPQSEVPQIDSLPNGQNESPNSQPDVDSLRSAIKMLDTSNAMGDVAAASGI